MHEISRHATHVTEVLSVTIETMKEIQRQQKVIYESLSSDLAKPYQEQAQEYMSFQLQMLKSLKLRSESNHDRLKSEITLVIKSPSSFLLSTHVLAIEAHRCRLFK
jgi:hypothetical protein